VDDVQIELVAGECTTVERGTKEETTGIVPRQLEVVDLEVSPSRDFR
jgi:hypothetical protein